MMTGGQVKEGAGSRNGCPQVTLEHACSIIGSQPWQYWNQCVSEAPGPEGTLGRCSRQSGHKE